MRHSKYIKEHSSLTDALNTGIAWAERLFSPDFSEFRDKLD